MIRHITLLLFLIGCLFGGEKTFVREFTYNGNWLDSKETARRISMSEINNILLQEIGIYVQSEINMETTEKIIEGQYELKEFYEEKIITISAGITKTEIVDEKWERKVKGIQYWIKAKITVDPDDIQDKINEVINNKELLANLDRTRKQAQDAMNELEMLKNQLAESEKEKEELKQKYEKNSNNLLATQLWQKAYHSGQTEDYKEAITFMLSAIELKPDFDKNVYAKMYANLATWNFVLASYNKAKEYYEKSIRFDPNYPNAYAGLRVCYGVEGDTIKAKELLEKAIDLDPNYAEPYSRLGFLFYKQSQYTKAKELLEKAIELDPYTAIPYYILAELYSIIGNLEMALPYFAKAKMYGDQDAENYLKDHGYNAYMNIGYNYYSEGNYTKAIDNYQKAISYDYDNIDVKKTERTYSYTFAVTGARSANSYLYMAVAYARQGNEKNALKYYEQSSTINPDIDLDSTNATAFYDLGYIFHSRNGDFYKGLIYYQKAARLGHQPVQDWLKKNGYDW